MKKNNKTGRSSIIIGILFAVCDALSSLFSSGLIYKFFTSHKEARKRFASSLTVAVYMKVRTTCRKISLATRKAVSGQFERSAFLTAFSSLAKS